MKLQWIREEKLAEARCQNPVFLFWLSCFGTLGGKKPNYDLLAEISMFVNLDLQMSWKMLCLLPVRILVSVSNSSWTEFGFMWLPSTVCAITPAVVDSQHHDRVWAVFRYWQTRSVLQFQHGSRSAGCRSKGLALYSVGSFELWQTTKYLCVSVSSSAKWDWHLHWLRLSSWLLLTLESSPVEAECSIHHH